ncbi:GGDEF domain-containing protein [Butyrivibrio sp. VCB2006]|uniref:GGDEF domain-containing protein n=1 Tax=Butyrivibrio sp. VCB2006 TaxID=1280679 RepID=UPI0009DC1F83|nr:GGDEF domain-containing protein [Butyrivibrio sp. VCB2006]
MKTNDSKMSVRDRTYRELDDVDYLDQQQYLGFSIGLCVVHCLLEILYIAFGCTPMIIINVASILTYVVSAFIVLKGRTLTSVWIMILEVYFHVALATIFLGVKAGVQLWLFGTLASIFLPIFSPKLSQKQKRQIFTFSAVIIITFIMLTYLGNHGLLSTRYNISDGLAEIVFYVNAVISFLAIILDTGIYNFRMSKKNFELQSAADHDYLTGIYNRKRMQIILDAEVERAKSYPDSNLSIAIVDIDYFKNINDTYGHNVGDEALRELVTIFKANSGSGLLYGRWGGEEFMLIAPESISFKEFGEFLENLRLQVQNHKFESEGQRIGLTISIGAATYNSDMTVDRFVNTADDKLYNAKESGRNRVVY